MFLLGLLSVSTVSATVIQTLKPPEKQRYTESTHCICSGATLEHIDTILSWTSHPTGALHSQWLTLWPLQSFYSTLSPAVSSSLDVSFFSFFFIPQEPIWPMRPRGLTTPLTQTRLSSTLREATLEPTRKRNTSSRWGRGGQSGGGKESEEENLEDPAGGERKGKTSICFHNCFSSLLYWRDVWQG